MKDEHTRILLVGVMLMIAMIIAIVSGTVLSPAIEQPAFPSPAPAPFPLNEEGIPTPPEEVEFMPRAEAPAATQSADDDVLGASTDGATTAIAIMTSVNQRRTAAGLPALNYDARLANGAAGRAAYLLRTKQWSHYGYVSAIRRSGYPFVHCGENLAKEFVGNDANAIVAAWMSSPTHRANIMNAAWQDAGIGIAGDRVVMWFGYTQ